MPRAAAGPAGPVDAVGVPPEGEPPARHRAQPARGAGVQIRAGAAPPRPVEAATKDPWPCTQL